MISILASKVALLAASEGWGGISDALEKFAQDGDKIAVGLAVIGIFITGLMLAIPVKSIREFGKENIVWIVLGIICICGATVIGQAIAKGFVFG